MESIKSSRKIIFVLPVVVMIALLLLPAWLKSKTPNPWGIEKVHPTYIVVERSKFKLYYLKKGKVVRVFPVVVGKPRTQTPLGKWRVAKKITFAKLGIYGFHKLQLAMLDASRFVPTIYALHGTNQEELLKKVPRMYSNGCVRMYNSDIYWLWRNVPTGTPVSIVP